MNDTQPHDSWDNDKVEIIDLPEREGSKATYHKLIMRLQQKVRLPTLIWELRIGLVLMVGLLIVVILLQTPLFSLNKNIAKQPTAPARITGIAALNGYVYINASDGSLAAYHSSDGKLSWRVNLGAAEYYFAIASEQAIYSFLAKGDYGRVEAFRASNGSLLWTHQDTFTGLVWMMVRDGIVYINTERGVIYALRGSDGRQLWQFTAGMPMPFEGFLAVNNGVVSIQTSNNLLYLLRESDGVPIYHYTSLLTIHDIVFPDVQGDLISIVSNDGSVQVRNVNNGSLVWQYNPVIGAGAWLPTVLGEIVYINNPVDGLVQALRVQNGALLWQFKLTASTDPPVLDKGIAYMTAADGSMFALSTTDGTLLWHIKLPTSTVKVAFSPVIDNNILYVNLNQPGSTVFAIRTSDGRLLWQRTLYTATSVYPPAVNDGIIYLGNDDHSIDAWQGSDGRFLWHYNAPSQIIWDPVVLDGIMFVRSSSGTMDVLRITDGMHLWHFPLQK